MCWQVVVDVLIAADGMYSMPLAQETRAGGNGTKTVPEMLER